MWKACLAVIIGSAFGGLLRWWLSIRLNHIASPFPLGTLIANLVAGYLVGIFVAFFLSRPDVPLAWKLLLVTGLCGGLSTFSSFSAEMVFLLQQQRYLYAFAGIATHVAGSLLMTALGMMTWFWLKR